MDPDGNLTICGFQGKMWGNSRFEFKIKMNRQTVTLTRVHFSGSGQWTSFHRKSILLIGVPCSALRRRRRRCLSHAFNLFSASATAARISGGISASEW